MTSPAEPHRTPFVPIALAVTGGILALGGSSATYVREGMLFGLGGRDVDWLYLFVSVVAVLLAAGLLVIRRLRSEWPFEVEDEPRRGVPLPLAAFVAGVGAGCFGGLLHHLDIEHVHVATTIMILAFVPAALLAIAVGATSLTQGVASAVLFALGHEPAAQLGVWIGRGRTGRLYWDDLTAFSAAFLVAGLVLVFAVAAIRRKLRPNFS